MSILKSKDYTGYSEFSINEAINDALQKAEEHNRFEIVETLGSQYQDKRHYQVTLITYLD